METPTIDIEILVGLMVGMLTIMAILVNWLKSSIYKDIKIALNDFGETLEKRFVLTSAYEKDKQIAQKDRQLAAIQSKTTGEQAI